MCFFFLLRHHHVPSHHFRKKSMIWIVLTQICHIQVLLDILTNLDVGPHLNIANFRFIVQLFNPWEEITQGLGVELSRSRQLLDIRKVETRGRNMIVIY